MKAHSFFDRLEFAPDQFQREAVAAFERGSSVVVVAPTAAGKTMVAEAAIDITLREGRRSFYTAPIKALSNQKFADLRDAYGEASVGLLTGDNAINGNAPVVVMTTEVLRNMIYADSSSLANLGVVVLDEVHYLQDRQRGSVWEEIIIHLPQAVPVVALSATIANSEEFNGWMAARRGGCQLIVEETRPVPLESRYMVQDRHRDGAITLLPVHDRTGRRPNPELTGLLGRSRGRHRRFVGPRRLDVVEELVGRGLDPLIYFIFSRAGVDQSADLVAGAGLGLTTPEERKKIRDLVEQRTSHLARDDLAVLGFARWFGNLEQGVASHHAGLVPAFKEIVEELFLANVVKLIFATETLSVGLNMPARTVVLERLSKFNGESHDLLRAGDYAQLTGRAGRRGIDDEGTAIVVHDSNVPLDQVATIAGAGSHRLTSNFQPNFNMVLNLVANYSRQQAEELLAASFAQFTSSLRRSVLAGQETQLLAEIAELSTSAESDFGDVWAYAANGRDSGGHSVLRKFVRLIEAGDVLRLTPGDTELWVLIARGYGSNPRLVVVNVDAEVRKLTAANLQPTVTRLGTIQLPEPVRSRESGYQRRVARMLRDFAVDPAVESRPGLDSVGDPVERDPGLATKLEAVRRVGSLRKSLKKLKRHRQRSLLDSSGEFFQRLRLLKDFGYTSGWELTESGEALRLIYNDLDLVLAETVASGVFDLLGPADLAAAMTLFTFEPRSADDSAGWPTDDSANAGEAVLSAHQVLATAIAAHGLEPTRFPDAGFAAAAFSWASGVSLADLFDDGDTTVGDFVRNVRQLLDLLRQLCTAYPQLAESAGQAIRRIDRGVVAAGGRR